MSTRILTCPACHHDLNVSAALAEGKMVICPACACRFPSVPLPMAVVARRAKKSPSLLYAVAGALVLLTGVGLGIGLYRFFTAPSPTAPVVNVDAAATPTNGTFQEFMVQGNDALAHGDFPAAVRAYQMAQQLSPTNVDAARGLAAARAEVAGSFIETAPALMPPAPLTPDVGGTPPPDPVDPVEAARTAFRNWMDQGQAALIDGKYDAATKCYREALKVAPTTRHRADNAAALDGLRKAGYAQAMADADHHMRAAKYEAAVHDYQTALEKMPGDPTASNGLIHARSFAMSK